MKKIKLMTIIGTRPEIIRMAEIIKKCDIYFDNILVHTGQNYDYDLNQVFFEDLNLRDPDIFLNAVGKNLGETIGNIISKTYDVLIEKKPDAVLVLGDTNSCLSTISAKRLHIPVFHIEAGNRCFDECLPEELNRRIVDHIADVNLCYSENARRYLLMEGRPKDRTFVVGSPMREVLKNNLLKIENSNILNELKLEKKKYILLSAHREENIDNEENFYRLFNSINQLAKIYDLPILYSMHPRSKKFLSERNFIFDKRVFSHNPLSFSDYNNLQINSLVVISDSGTLPEESDFFASINKPFPAVCIRTSTERPEAIEQGRFIISGLHEESIISSVDMAINLINDNEYGFNVIDYSYDDISMKIVKIIQSYTHIVNQFVWRKNIINE